MWPQLTCSCAQPVTCNTYLFRIFIPTHFLILSLVALLHFYPDIDRLSVNWDPDNYHCMDVATCFCPQISQGVLFHHHPFSAILQLSTTIFKVSKLKGWLFWFLSFFSNCRFTWDDLVWWELSNFKQLWFILGGALKPEIPLKSKALKARNFFF